jgi:homoserine dehydrogenase
MNTGHRVGVGMIGMGVVGGGVARILQDRADHFRSARGIDLQLRRVAVRDVAKPRSMKLADGVLVDDARLVIDDPEVDVVIEVMGGIQPAHGLCLRALEAGKDVVSANKALLAENGDELFAAAAASGTDIAFGASVCGGIPIIQTLKDGLVANRIESLYGILNGTTNYILTRMTDDGGHFEEALSQAQDKGFAEADPTLDIDGTDAAQKLSLLCRIAFGVEVAPSAILKEGISHISPIDIDFARELGYTIKLLAIAKMRGEGIEARVHPALVPSGALLANVKDEFNAVEVMGSAVGPQVFHGRGAGEMPTASAIVSDLVDVAERRTDGRNGCGRLRPCEPAHLVPPEDVHTSAYFRFTVHDRPGVIAQIAQIFSEEQISIAMVIQHGRSEVVGGAVPLIITAHEAPESHMRRAVAAIDQLPVILEKSQVVRIESV